MLGFCKSGHIWLLWLVMHKCTVSSSLTKLMFAGRSTIMIGTCKSYGRVGYKQTCNISNMDIAYVASISKYAENGYLYVISNMLRLFNNTVTFYSGSHACTHTHTHTHTQTHAHTHTHTHTYTRMSAPSLYANSYYIHACTHTILHTCIYIWLEKLKKKIK